MESLYHGILSSDTKVITATLAIVGTFIAAVLSSAGYLYRIRTEQKKSLRRVLYLMLEIRHAVTERLFDPDAATDEYLNEISKRLEARGLKGEEDEFPEIYRELISSHFKNVISSLQTELDERLITPFEEALLEMSAVAPTLAFKLRGREKLERVIGHTKQYISQLPNKLEGDIPEPELKNTQEAFNKIKEDALNEIYETLNNDALVLAQECSWSDFRACKKIIETGINPKQNLDFSELDSLIDTLIKSITKTHNHDGEHPISAEIQSNKEASPSIPTSHC